MPGLLSVGPFGKVKNIPTCHNISQFTQLETCTRPQIPKSRPAIGEITKINLYDKRVSV